VDLLAVDRIERLVGEGHLQRELEKKKRRRRRFGFSQKKDLFMGQ
jgi:hypothetical protein